MKAAHRYRRRVHLRVMLFGLACSLWVGLMAARLVYLQTVARESLQERAELQQQHTLTLEATRGSIYDRNGRALAISVEVESVYAVPVSIEEPETTAARLTSCLGGDAARLAERLRTQRRFCWVKRKVGRTAAECVRRFNLRGVSFVPESRRFYPKRTVASHVLGYVGMDNEGMSGVEYALETHIRGEAGRRIIWTDAWKRRAASRVEKRSQPGRSVYLTLDETLQHIAETQLRRAVEQTGSKAGMAILMRPETGELLAMAAVPGFNPNRYQDYPESTWRNRAVTDTYEPGSTFKVIVAASALEEGVVSEEERIDCGRGVIRVGDRLVHDHKVFDVLSFRDVLALSSNVGMIRIAQRLGRQRLENAIRRFGFGEPTGVELSGESRGILRPASSWGPRTLASIAFGQEIAVTPLQMVAAVNAIASSGYLMRPRLLREIRSPEGERLASFAPEPVRRVVSRRTAARLTELMIGVVERGTGVRAAIGGFEVAGKTGTAQKAAPEGGYSSTDYVASFVGFVPARRPELTALVILDSPEGDHTGARAAEVFASIVEPSLHYMNVAPYRKGGALPVLARWPRQAPLVASDTHEALATGWPVAAAALGGPRRGGEPPSVPDLRGLAARDAVARLVAAGLVPELVGSGWVLGQEPPPGRSAAPGASCRVFLGLRPPGVLDKALRIVDGSAGGEHQDAARGRGAS